MMIPTVDPGMPSASTALLAQLQRWVTVGALRAVDVALAGLILEQQPDTAVSVLLAVALTSERNSHGHVCLDLAAAHRQPQQLLHARQRAAPHQTPLDVAAELCARLAAVSLDEWLAQLGASGAVWNCLHGATDDGVAPLVVAGTNTQPLLYLRRYWRDEQRIVDGINGRLNRLLAVPEQSLRRLLDALFPEEKSPPPPLFQRGENQSPSLAKVDGGDLMKPGGGRDLPWEKIACALAARSAFAIITGGPGTGKTTTVVRLLALLQGLTLEAGQAPLRIRLAAPTGKAAARLNASIAGRVAELPLAAIAAGEHIRAAIPTEVTTLHRLLGPLPHSRHFRHHVGNPLPVDLVVIDEASMVDVEMLARLLEALHPAARLILLGDKDQLASVEAGAVLGDLCARAAAAHYTPTTCAWLQRVTGVTLPAEYVDSAGRALDQAIVMLRNSYRFQADGGIGALAALVNAEPAARQSGNQRGDAVLRLLAEQTTAAGQLTAMRLRDTNAAAFVDLVCDGYRGYLAAMHDGDPGADADQTAIDQWAQTVLAAQAQFQLLTALREGAWGVAGLNQHIVTLLHQAGLLPLRPSSESAAQSQWFAGRPVLVTRNEASLRLMNGDIGITLAVSMRHADAPNQPRRVLRVAFPAGDGSGGIRWILPSRLQAVETVFAMTVHKAQGSEFAHTALILPDAANPVLTQELLYTGITRSKQAFTLLYAEPAVLGEALSRRVARVSGIANALMTLNLATANSAPELAHV